MKKLLLCLLIVLSLTFVSCKKDPEPVETPTVTVSVDQSTIQDIYYTDEFEITTIKLIVTTDGSAESVTILPNMVSNLKDEYQEGKYTFNVNYLEKDISFDVVFKNRPLATQGINFSFENNEYHVISYNGTDPIVIIPEEFNHFPVTEISQSAFSDNDIIEEVNIPDTVKHIGDQAFKGCENLRRVEMSKNIEVIGKAAFYQDINLKSIYLSSSLTALRDKALDSIDVVYFENTLSALNIKDGTINDKAYIYENVVKGSVKTEGDYLYMENDDNTVTALEYYGDASSVALPATLGGKDLTVLGAHIFSGNLNITEIIFSAPIRLIMPYACQCTGIRELNCPETLTEIGQFAFGTCDDLAVLNFNEGLIKICDSAFSTNHKIQKVIFPSTLETIEAYAFMNALNCEYIYIPTSVTYIGTGAFYANGYAKIESGHAEKPSTWDASWNPSNRKVTWGVPQASQK